MVVESDINERLGCIRAMQRWDLAEVERHRDVARSLREESPRDSASILVEIANLADRLQIDEHARLNAWSDISGHYYANRILNRAAYENTAHLARRLGEHAIAACNFERLAECLKHSDEGWEPVHQALIEAKTSYTNAGLNSESSDCYYRSRLLAWGNEV